MYITEDNTKYYLYDRKKDKITTFSREELIKYLANKTVYSLEKHPNDWIYPWSKKMFWNDFDETNYLSIPSIDYTGNDKDIVYEYEAEKVSVTDKIFIYYDSNDRIIDVRNFKEDIIKYIYVHANELHRHTYIFHKRMGRKYHTTYNYGGKHTKRTRMLNSIPEYKMFYKAKNNELPYWWDDAMHRTSNGWKDNSKARKSWGKHKNIKNCSSIRKHQIDVDYDELLKELTMK